MYINHIHYRGAIILSFVESGLQSHFRKGEQFNGENSGRQYKNPKGS